MGTIVQASLKRCVAHLLASCVGHWVLDDGGLWCFKGARYAGNELIWRNTRVIAATRALLLAGLDWDKIAFLMTWVPVYHVELLVRRSSSTAVVVVRGI